jgi:small subunit ribosomal protein S20
MRYWRLEEVTLVAQHASAQKHERQSLKRRARNRSNLSRLKTQIKKLRAALAQKDADAAARLLPSTVASIDRAKKLGVIHDNSAARNKSRLTRKVNALRATA